MNRKNIIKNISSKTKIKKNIVSKVIKEFEILLIDALQKGEIISISGIAKLYTRQRGERTYTNFQTGNSFIVPPKVVPAIKFSKSFIEKF